MKRASLVLLTSGALVAAIAGTALAGGSDDGSPSRSSSSATATPTAGATVSSGPSSDAPVSSPSPWQSHAPSGSPTTAPTVDDTAGPTAASPATTPASPSVGSRRAGEIALSHVGSGTVTEVEAETEHGRTVWSVEILGNGSRYEVHVDRGSGEITRSRTKSDDDHGDDGNSGRHGRHHD
ncbi:PepSY domain-containing protein [Streptomyces sp. NPDC087844]|uniref:PepSY domain-containing protein n=1 Tax=Streptomyces sp. NPDC087844 TaxID=3365805 RepID=UPI00380D6B1A